MELLTFASRLFAPITFDHLLATSVMLFHFILPCEHAQLAELPARRSSLQYIRPVEYSRHHRFEIG